MNQPHQGHQGLVIEDSFICYTIVDICIEEWIQSLMILYLGVTAAGEQIRMSKLSEPHVKNTIVKIV